MVCDFVCISSVKAIEFLSCTSSDDTSSYEVRHCFKPGALGFILHMRVLYTCTVVELRFVTERKKQSPIYTLGVSFGKPK